MVIPRKRYLFIRILEACNADCFMCSYARSQDRYRFSVEEIERVLPQARELGVEFVRFTGGEPLLHKDIVALIDAGTAAGMKMSVITNGASLPKLIDPLSHAGLAQVIVSVDGASALTHDFYRNSPGLFAKCAEGLALARDRGVLTRVNTVVGPHNYVEMPQMQMWLTALGVRQWELSAIKLERPIAYADPAHVSAICDGIYAADPRTTLVPMGKRFYGDTVEERQLFFERGVTPRPSPPRCHLVGDVIYLDAKNGRGFGCSLLPHRSAEESGGGVLLRSDGAWALDTADFREHVNVFRAAGPTVCRGCSTTAAGYSDDVARSASIAPWQF
ncbi:MAG: cytosylglucuronate decarboxylase [Gemmatimonadetes bacterium]|nr:cytosylglucuronate decarboxylase [Gemmatimonadota bacterium]